MGNLRVKRSAKVEAAGSKMLPAAKRLKAMEQAALYNHGASVSPQNGAVCNRLRAIGTDHVGIVYNFHHGHGNIRRLAEQFTLMKSNFTA